MKSGPMSFRAAVKAALVAGAVGATFGASRTAACAA
jgi:hypothetical protein